MTRGVAPTAGPLPPPRIVLDRLPDTDSGHTSRAQAAPRGHGATRIRTVASTLPEASRRPSGLKPPRPEGVVARGGPARRMTRDRGSGADGNPAGGRGLRVGSGPAGQKVSRLSGAGQALRGPVARSRFRPKARLQRGRRGPLSESHLQAAVRTDRHSLRGDIPTEVISKPRLESTSHRTPWHAARSPSFHIALRETSLQRITSQ
jgi:hypothetical protein